jgi:hypothetical protein
MDRKISTLIILQKLIGKYTHIRLLVLYSGSMRMPASFSSALAISDSGGNDRRCIYRMCSLLGENERLGVGGASTITLISSAGI